MKKSSAKCSAFESEAIPDDDDISDKVKELVLSLPRKKWSSTISLYFYQNFWVPSPFLRGVVSFQDRFQARDSDILLISKPKSGTTWLQALAFAILNRGIYPTVDIDQNPNCKPHPLLSHHPQHLAPILEVMMSQTSKLNDRPNDLLGSHNHPQARLFATHLPYNALPDSIKTSSGCRIVYISRNILDTVISFWFFSHQIKEAAKEQGDSMRLEDYVESVCRGEESYGPHWDHVLGYWQESLKRPNKVLFIKYEDIKGDEIAAIKRLAEFMGCPFTSHEEESRVVEAIGRLCSIRSLKESSEVEKISENDSSIPVKHSAFYRKGEVGDWMNHMSTSMAR